MITPQAGVAGMSLHAGSCVEVPTATISTDMCIHKDWVKPALRNIRSIDFRLIIAQMGTCHFLRLPAHMHKLMNPLTHTQMDPQNTTRSQLNRVHSLNQISKNIRSWRLSPEHRSPGLAAVAPPATPSALTPPRLSGVLPAECSRR